MAVNLNRFYHVNLNVKNLNRSISFYESLGFEVTAKFVLEGDMARSTLEAFGQPYTTIDAAFMQLKNSPMILDLCEFQDPPTQGEAYRTLSNTGMARLAFHVDDIHDVYEKLTKMDVEMLGPLRFSKPPGGESCGVFAFRDPDGIILEVLSGVDHMTVYPK